MTKEELIIILNYYEKKCENADTWFNSDLVEDSLSIVETVKEYLKDN